MILRFSSGSLTPASASRKRFSRVDDVQVDAGRGDEVALDLLGLALAQQAVVDEHAGEPVADRPLHERPRRPPSRRRRRGRRSPAVSPTCARIRSICSSTMLTIVQVGPAAGDVEQEVLEHLLAVLGVQHLGVPLHAGEPAVEVLERGDRGAGGRGEHVEARGRRDDRVAVAHPDPVLGAGTSASRVPGVGDLDGGAAVLRAAGARDLAAEA